MFKADFPWKQWALSKAIAAISMLSELLVLAAQSIPLALVHLLWLKDSAFH